MGTMANSPPTTIRARRGPAAPQIIGPARRENTAAMVATLFTSALAILGSKVRRRACTTSGGTRTPSRLMVSATRGEWVCLWGLATGASAGMTHYAPGGSPLLIG